MAPFAPEQQKQQEEAAAAGYSQLPGGNAPAFSIAGPTGQPFYPAVSPPPYPNPASYNGAGSPAPAAYPPQQYAPYPPQQYAAAPHAYSPAAAPGVAVTGYPAAAPGQPMQPMAVAAAGPVQGSPTFLDQQPCGCCTVGWVLFGFGWLFPICWVVGALLPFCSKNRHDRRAAIASGIMIAISVVIIVLAVAIPLSILASEARNNNLTTPLGTYNGYSPNYNYNGH